MAPLRLDLHVHTRVSPDGLDAPEVVVRAARAAGLDGIAITDHDRGAGYRRLVELGLADPRGLPVDGFLVVPGVEVSTLQGHVLVLGAALDMPARSGGIDAGALVNLCRARGLLAIAAHPLDRTRSGIGARVCASAGFHAVEVFNSKTLEPGANLRAAVLARELGLPAVAGSDAHEAALVGRAHTLVKAEAFTVQGVLGAIAAGRTAIHAGRHTHAEVARCIARGWLTRPWMLDWAARAATETLGRVNPRRRRLGPAPELIETPAAA